MYYMNRKIDNGFIVYYDKNDKDADAEAIRAGRINCGQFDYCQMDETKILQVEMSYQDRRSKMIRIDSRDDVVMWWLSSYPGENRGQSTLCRVNSNIAFLIGGLNKN